jgi:hypothetical protein
MYECQYFQEIAVHEQISAFCIVPLIDDRTFTQIMDHYGTIYRPSWTHRVGRWYIWNDGSPEILETLARFIDMYFDICEEHEYNIVKSTLV